MLVLEGRRPNGKWGTMDLLGAENAEAEEKNKPELARQLAEVKLHKWFAEAQSVNGAFVNWEFRLAQREKVKPVKGR